MFIQKQTLWEPQESRLKQRLSPLQRPGLHVAFWCMFFLHSAPKSTSSSLPIYAHERAKNIFTCCGGKQIHILALRVLLCWTLTGEVAPTIKKSRCVFDLSNGQLCLTSARKQAPNIKLVFYQLRSLWCVQVQLLSLETGNMREHKSSVENFTSPCELTHHRSVCFYISQFLRDKWRQRG